MKFRQVLMLATGTIISINAIQVSANSDVMWNGYLNVIGSISDSNEEYREDISEDSTFSATSFGLTATKRINSKLSIAGQMHGQFDSFNFDWGYATYRLNSEWTGKAGKIKYPGTLLSEIIDIGVTYPWTQAPIAVYGLDAGMSFEAYTGGAMVYTVGDDIEYSSEFYLGETSDVDSNHKGLLGVVLSATSDEVRAQVGFNTSTMEFEDPAAPNASLMGGRDMSIMNLGVKAEYDIATIYAEYAKTTTSGLSIMDRSGWYITALHSFGKWSPHITYQDYEGMANREETTIIAGLNRTIDASTVVKFDVQQIKPVNGGFFEAQPDSSKVYLLNASLNMIF